MKLTFTCPNCKHNLLEEIASCEAVVSPIAKVTMTDGIAIVEYGGPPSIEGDCFIVRYQCEHCGYVLCDDSDSPEIPIDSAEQLAEWLNNPRK